MDYTPPVRIGPKTTKKKKKEIMFATRANPQGTTGNIHPKWEIFILHRQSPTCHADMIRLSEWRIGLALPESPDAQTEQR